MSLASAPTELGGGRFVRIGSVERALVHFVLNGQSCEARDGDTILTAILMHRRYLRAFEFGGEVRAGFCLMGACQDCWVEMASGQRVRACTTLLSDGMVLNLTGRDPSND